MNFNDKGLTNTPEKLRELARDPEHLKKLVALWADNTFVHHLAAELLAVREAQPVAHIFKHPNGRLFWQLIDDSQAGHKDVIPVYAAPPAPAVTDERDSFECFVAQRFGKSVDQRRAKNGDNEYMAWDMPMAWAAWQGRAAMLENSPAGFKLMPIEMTDEIGEAIAMEANCCGGIALDIYNAALAAAPTPTK